MIAIAGITDGTNDDDDDDSDDGFDHNDDDETQAKTGAVAGVSSLNLTAESLQQQTNANIKMRKKENFEKIEVDRGSRGSTTSIFR